MPSKLELFRVANGFSLYSLLLLRQLASGAIFQQPRAASFLLKEKPSTWLVGVLLPAAVARHGVSVADLLLAGGGDFFLSARTPESLLPPPCRTAPKRCPTRAGRCFFFPTDYTSLSSPVSMSSPSPSSSLWLSRTIPTCTASLRRAYEERRFLLFSLRPNEAFFFSLPRESWFSSLRALS